MFKVIDMRTGKEPIFDHNHIFKEKWFKASGLIYCDIDGWYIGEDGELVLIDDCGNVGYPPVDRFDVIFDKEEIDKTETTRTHGEWKTEPHSRIIHCSNCDAIENLNRLYVSKFCYSCGSLMVKEGENHDV